MHLKATGGVFFQTTWLCCENESASCCSVALVKLHRPQSISFFKGVFLTEPRALITGFETGLFKHRLHFHRLVWHARSRRPRRRYITFFFCEKGTRLQDCAPKPSPKFTLCFLIKPHVSFLLHSESSKEIWFLLFGTDLLSGSLDHQSGRWGLLIHRLNHFRSLSSASDCPPPRGKLRRGGWCEGPDYFLAHSRATSKPASLKCICASLFPGSNDSLYPAANESSGQASHEETDVLI